jgi:hypothetical protein
MLLMLGKDHLGAREMAIGRICVRGVGVGLHGGSSLSFLSMSSVITAVAEVEAGRAFLLVETLPELLWSVFGEAFLAVVFVTLAEGSPCLEGNLVRTIKDHHVLGL